MYGKKRKYTTGSSKGSSSINKLLESIRNKRKQYPRKDYANIYWPRGTQQGIDMFGATAKTANPAQLSSRQITGFKGRGKYSVWDTVGKVAEDVGSAALIAGMGRYGTTDSGDTITGKGVYTYHDKNQLFANSGKNQPTKFFSNNSELGSLTISKREWVGNILAPPLVDPSANSSPNNPCVPFYAQQLRLNPGDSHVFPWLSQIARNFTEYTFDQLVFEYESGVDAANSETGNTGSICIVSTLNPSQPPLLNETAFMGESGNVSTRLTNNALMGVECDPRKGVKYPKYVSSGSYSYDTYTDIDDYDAAVLQWAIVGCPGVFANQNIGKLYVTYTVTLQKPRLFDTLGYGIICDTFASAGKYNLVNGVVGEKYDGIAPPGTSLTSDQNTNQNPVKSFLYSGLGLKGLHNKLDIKLFPVFMKSEADSTWFRGGCAFVFPEWVQGDFKLNYTYATGNQDANDQNEIKTNDYNYDKYDEDPAGFTAGNIQLISDISCGAPIDNKWSWFKPTVYNNITDANELFFSFEMHVRVSKATSGIQNIAFMPTVYDGSNIPSAGAVDISIQQYSPLNYSIAKGGTFLNSYNEATKAYVA